MSETRERISLKFWQDAGILNAIAQAADTYYDQVQGYFAWLLGTVDAETAPIELVELLAWERDIDRMSGEDDALFRKRVKYALANAKDAGSKVGFERIWTRLGLGSVSQRERVDAENWDVIKLTIDETIFGKYVDLLDTLLRQYGRTCRRYEFESTIPQPSVIRTFDFEHATLYSAAVIRDQTAPISGRPMQFYNDATSIVARA